MALTQKQKEKENIAKIFINTGSITFAGVVLGYFVSENKITEREFIIGIIGMILAYLISIFIEK